MVCAAYLKGAEGTIGGRSALAFKNCTDTKSMSYLQPQSTEENNTFLLVDYI